MRLLVTMIALFGISTAHAQEGQTAAQLENTTSVMPSGLVPFLGLGAGYTNYHRDADVEGVPSSLKLLGSYYLESQKVVFDLGAGISGQRFSQTAAADRSISGATVEAAARYQWANRWQAGVNVMNLMDQGSSYGANQADAHFAGLQALKEFKIGERWIGRAGARLMADVNVDERTVAMAMLDLQVGWNPAPRSPSVTTVSAQNNAPATRAPATATEKPGIAKFDVDSNELSAADRAELKKIAQRLAEMPKGEVSSIEVVGHADPTGSSARNVRLSEARALTVKEVMANEGVTVPVRVIGKGSTEAQGENYEEQRRVDLRFNGVKDEAALKDILGL